MEIVIWSAARAIERLMVVAGGILAIWLGYRLFSLVVADRGAFEAQSGRWSLRLQRIGPGVFFALFGSGILAFAVSSPITTTMTTTTTPDGVTTDLSSKRWGADAPGFVTDESRAEDLARAITLTASYIARSPNLAELPAEDRAILNDQVSKLSNFRQELVDSIYDPGAAEWYFETYQTVRRDRATLERLSPVERRKYDHIRSLMQVAEGAP